MTSKINYLNILFALLFIAPLMGVSQIAKQDSLSLMEVVTDFQESIAKKDSIRFNQLFFTESVSFVGIMSKDTEWSIKKNYAEFQGIAVSDHKSFINDICKSEKMSKEKFYDIELSTDGFIGSISFNYAFLSGDKMIQWGHEKWNLVREGEKWLITDVIYTIRFPKVEPFPYE